MLIIRNIHQPQNKESETPIKTKFHVIKNIINTKIYVKFLVHKSQVFQEHQSITQNKRHMLGCLGSKTIAHWWIMTSLNMCHLSLQFETCYFPTLEHQNITQKKTRAM